MLNQHLDFLFLEIYWFDAEIRILNFNLMPYAQEGIYDRIQLIVIDIQWLLSHLWCSHSSIHICGPICLHLAILLMTGSTGYILHMILSPFLVHICILLLVCVFNPV